MELFYKLVSPNRFREDLQKLEIPSEEEIEKKLSADFLIWIVWSMRWS
jgi:hypothetical protein